MKNYNVLVVEDHELIISGIRQLLADNNRFNLVAHLGDGLGVYNTCHQHQPDIVVLDLNLPGIHGVDLISQLHNRWPKMGILVYTAHVEESMCIRALSAGALSYVLKCSTRQIFLAALQMTSLGKRYIDPTLNHDVILPALEASNNTQELLTVRERQILKLIAEGFTNRSISEKLFISIKTVETHRLNIMRKLSAHKVTELLTYSRRLGLIV